MSKNFSAPSSKAKPASVTTMSAYASAARVAVMLLVPWAMLANGPPCTNAGAPSVRLHQVRLDRVAQQRGHGADGPEVAGRDRRLPSDV